MRFCKLRGLLYMLLSPFYDMIIRFCGHKIDQPYTSAKISTVPAVQPMNNLVFVMPNSRSIRRISGNAMEI